MSSLSCCLDILQYSAISVSLCLSTFNRHILVLLWTSADLTAQHPCPFVLVRTTVFSFGKLPPPNWIVGLTEHSWDFPSSGSGREIQAWLIKLSSQNLNLEQKNTRVKNIGVHSSHYWWKCLWGLATQIPPKLLCQYIPTRGSSAFPSIFSTVFFWS